MQRLRDNYPFFHPRYVGQMLKPPHPAAIVGYLSAMLINPNNHALDGGPATAAHGEGGGRRAGRDVRLPATHLGHLTSSGTIANLEALFDRPGKLHPGQGHRVQRRRALHARAGCASCSASSGDRRARRRAAAGWTSTRWRSCWRPGDVGTVVVDRGHHRARGGRPARPRSLAALPRYGVRVHVDAAYGGFFTLIADDTADGVAGGPFARHRRRATRWWSIRTSTGCSRTAAARCSSATRPSAGSTCTTRPTPTSPPTSCTSGEISLECSRAGAAAAALWLTLAAAAADRRRPRSGAARRPRGRAGLGRS